MSELILPLGLAEPRHLQALISSFELTRIGDGSLLEVRIDNNTEAIWNDRGKVTAQTRVQDFEKRASQYQSELDNYLLFNIGPRFLSRTPTSGFDTQAAERFRSSGTGKRTTTASSIEKFSRLAGTSRMVAATPA